jgi:hypothetical protein
MRLRPTIRRRLVADAWQPDVDGDVKQESELKRDNDEDNGDNDEDNGDYDEDVEDDESKEEGERKRDTDADEDDEKVPVSAPASRPTRPLLDSEVADLRSPGDDASGGRRRRRRRNA